MDAWQRRFLQEFSRAGGRCGNMGRRLCLAGFARQDAETPREQSLPLGKVKLLRNFTCNSTLAYFNGTTSKLILMNIKAIAVTLSVLALECVICTGAPLGTAFTYQGQLQQDGNLVTARCDLRFLLFDAPAGGNVVGGPLLQAAVPVSNGLFAVTLDFGSAAFNGEERWVEIAVKTPAGETIPFITLAPRQLITAAPQAVYAAKAGQMPATNLVGQIGESQLPPNIARLNSNQTFIGTVSFSSTNGVGISTITPPAKPLDVVGSLRLQGKDMLLNWQGGLLGSGIGFREDFGGAAVGGPVVFAQNGGALGVKSSLGDTGELAVLRWDRSGRVGIGGGAFGNGSLTVNGDVHLRDGDVFLKGNDSVGYHGIGYRYDFMNGLLDGPVVYGWGGGALASKQEQGFRTALQWDSAGRVGIGTATPSSKLSLGGDKADTKLALYDANAPDLFGFGIQDYQFRIHLGSASSRFSFLDTPGGSNELMTIQGTGNVGIGTPNPLSTLDVAGSVSAYSFAGSGAGLFGVNADRLDGLHATAFAQLAANQTFSGENQFNGNVGIRLASAPASALHVGGAVTIGNTIDPAPPAGTMRWNGSAFEGFNGAAWVPLTQAGPPVLATNHFTNMVWVAAGSFTMGSPTNANEMPQTTVNIAGGFWIGIHEVTQAEYSSLMNTNPSYFLGDLSRPVERVSWYDAVNYCATLTVRERAAGQIPNTWVYRLPTEAEWEYACRAGTTTRFSYGDDNGYSSLANYAWYSANSVNQAHPVGQKPPNAWLIWDMHGNVSEWCSDWYGTYLGGTVTNPKGPASGSLRVARGGAFNSNGDSCRSASRGSDSPATSGSYRGFRVVLAQSP